MVLQAEICPDINPVSVRAALRTRTIRRDLKKYRSIIMNFALQRPGYPGELFPQSIRELVGGSGYMEDCRRN